MYPLFVPSQRNYLDDNRHLVLIMNHAQNPPEYFDVLFKEGNLPAYQFLVSYNKTPAEILHKIALAHKDKVHVHGKCYEPGRCKEWLEVSILKFIAENPSTLAKTLDLIAKSAEDGVRRAVAQNKSTRPQTLSSLASDQCFLVRSAVAENPQTPLSALKVMFDKEKEFCVIRDAVGNAKTTSQMIGIAFKKILNMDPETARKYGFSGVPEAMKENPKTPKYILQRIEKENLIRP